MKLKRKQPGIYAINTKEITIKLKADKKRFSLLSPSPPHLIDYLLQAAKTLAWHATQMEMNSRGLLLQLFLIFVHLPSEVCGEPYRDAPFAPTSPPCPFSLALPSLS